MTDRPHRLRRLRLMLINLAAFALLALTSSCKGSLYEKTERFENATWSSQTPRFEFDITDTSQLYDIILEVVHSSDYGYQNLYTQLKVEFPDTTAPRTTLLSLQLSDEHGTWQGKCSGTRCTTPLAFMTKTKFAATGKHSLTFAQHTRFEQIEGIEQITLRLLKHQGTN